MDIICNTCKGKIKYGYFKVYYEHFHDNEYCLYETYTLEEYNKLYDKENEEQESWDNDLVYYSALEEG